MKAKSIRKKEKGKPEEVTNGGINKVQKKTKKNMKKQRNKIVIIKKAKKFS